MGVLAFLVGIALALVADFEIKQAFLEADFRWVAPWDPPRTYALAMGLQTAGLRACLLGLMVVVGWGARWVAAKIWMR
jgi:hypothetical protein